MKNYVQKNQTKSNPSLFKKRNITWFLAFILLSLHVFIAVQVSSAGARIVLYEEEIKKLERENNELSMNIINSTSLTKLGQVSEEMGFKKINNTLYLQLGESFAKAQ